ncbi:Tripartite-type tricarboxylate transporter, receptor component TctC [Variovorax sp. YR750]|uniref:Bug family tripartite tricarboxylate transporter substrate binding protein n=1 Tax=Variovorax sp. YR750 TaxID=1884384 RepID=UPI0008CC8934|nr:tripartite tricarboxylate transporter substrate binding protein [Variovorax sp. YR750]SEM03752.1 Tripartite-type tricarboxylate transporter, receptor component TctC [Variovorax sp. YR750]
MHHPIKTLVITACVAAAAATSAYAAEWPTAKPIRIVVGAAPGGSTDLIARQIAEGLGTRLSATVIVENRPGAGGTVAAELVSRDAPDGYTLMLGTVSTHAVAPSVFAKLRYDPVKDFTAITPVATIPNVMVVNTASPIKSLQELVATAKANPGKLSYASNGPGTSNGLATAQFAALAGIKMADIPYKGANPALTDLVGGQIDLMLDVVMTSQPYIQGGKLRPLAVTSLKRSALLPNVPTVAEQGYPGFEAIVWFGVFGPPKMAPDLTARLNKELAAVITGPKMTEYLGRQGAVPTVSSPTEFSNYVRADIDKWAKAAQAAGVKPE